MKLSASSSARPLNVGALMPVDFTMFTLSALFVLSIEQMREVVTDRSPLFLHQLCRSRFNCYVNSCGTVATSRVKPAVQVVKRYNSIIRNV